MNPLWIPGRLPGLNEIIDACKIQSKNKKWNAYHKMKVQWGGTIGLLARSQKFPIIKPHGRWIYYFAEPNKLRDPSNFISGGMKLIEDALQECGLLKDDGWKYVESISHDWGVDKEKPGVLLEVRYDKTDQTQK